MSPHASATQQTMLPQAGGNIAVWLDSSVARFAARSYDWDALKFQATFDTKYRRAQMRYAGIDATSLASDDNTVPVGNFTFSTMAIPAAHEGSSHIHYDMEANFVMLRGTPKVVCDKDGQRWEMVRKDRDHLSVPQGAYREDINIGDEDALMCVMLGSPAPICPVCPPDSPLAGLEF